jgi:hypothetical protein
VGVSPLRSRGSTRRSRGRGFRGVTELQNNGFQDFLQPTQDVICGKPEHPEPATHQPCGPPIVIFGLSVVDRPVDLDQQSRLEAGEVDDVRTDRRLPAEAVAPKLPAA